MIFVNHNKYISTGVNKSHFQTNGKNSSGTNNSEHQFRLIRFFPYRSLLTITGWSAHLHGYKSVQRVKTGSYIHHIKGV